jgi:hypothetical protein
LKGRARRGDGKTPGQLDITPGPSADQQNHRYHWNFTNEARPLRHFRSTAFRPSLTRLEGRAVPAPIIPGLVDPGLVPTNPIDTQPPMSGIDGVFILADHLPITVA